MKIAISAGHNPDGKIACGAVGILKESTENRYIVKHLIKRNNKKKKIKVVFNETVNNAENQKEHLEKCSYYHNLVSDRVDFHVQVHFNSSNGFGKGSEVLIKNGENKKLIAVGNEILKNLASLGFENRGIKEKSDLYMLNHVRNMMILEVCFVDNQEDAKKYKENKKEVVKAIYKGLWKGYAKYMDIKG